MNERIDIKIPDIFQSLHDEARYYVYYGGRGSGKSHTIARYLICEALQQTLKILCTRELQNSIQESVYTLLVGIINEYNLYQWFNIKNASIEAFNRSQFIFKGLAHNIESVKSTEGVDRCWIEEADKVCQNSWDILIPTIRKAGSKFFITFNPTFDDDPVYQMFVTQHMPNSVTQLVNYHDNPHFPDVLRREMEHMKSTDYDKYCHVWEGALRTISDAQIFKNKFVVEEFSSDGVEAFRYGMDFGFANDPSALVRCFIMGNDLYIDREEYGHHVEIPDLIPMIRHIQAGTESFRWKIKADCARPETISYLANLNYNVVSASKWQGSVEDGIEYIRSFKRVVIHPRCPHTIEEFRRYSYKVDKHTNEILPIVKDDYNHCIDSLRYALDDMIKHNCTIYDVGVL